jgi:two-component system cell cycle sensor histidine kinase/response regulator CckA
MSMTDRSAENASILLLASDPLMRTVLRDTLAGAGYLVVMASGLGEAVDRLKEMRPDLLIVRPYVESMPANDAAEYLRTKRPGLRVLMVSGFIEDDRVRNRNDLANFHVFPKPFTADELLAQVGALLGTS